MEVVEVLDECGEFPAVSAILGVGAGVKVDDEHRFFFVDYDRPSLVDLDLAARMRNICRFEHAA